MLIEPSCVTCYAFLTDKPPRVTFTLLLPSVAFGGYFLFRAFWAMGGVTRSLLGAVDLTRTDIWV